MGENISGPISTVSANTNDVVWGNQEIKGRSGQDNYFTEPPPEEMSLSGGEDTIDLLRKWNHCDQEEKSFLCEYQETLMGDIMKLQDTIWRGGRDEER